MENGILEDPPSPESERKCPWDSQLAPKCSRRRDTGPSVLLPKLCLRLGSRPSRITTTSRGRLPTPSPDQVLNRLVGLICPKPGTPHPSESLPLGSLFPTLQSLPRLRQVSCLLATRKPLPRHLTSPSTPVDPSLTTTAKALFPQNKRLDGDITPLLHDLLWLPRPPEISTSFLPEVLNLPMIPMLLCFPVSFSSFGNSALCFLGGQGRRHNLPLCLMWFGTAFSPRSSRAL